MSVNNTVIKQLSTRWPTDWINDAGRLGKTHEVFTGVGVLFDKLAQHKAQIEKPGTLSQKGITESLRDFAAKNVVPHLRRSQHKLEQSLDEITARRLRLGAPNINQKDAVSAMHREEIRKTIREMQPSDRTGFALKNTDPSVVAAILEMPAFVSGISEEIRSKVEQMAVERAAPEALEQFENEREAVALADAAIRATVNELRVATDLEGQPLVFDRWMEEASKDVEAEISRANAGKATNPGLNPELVFEDLLSLSAEDRGAIIDKYLGKQLDNVGKE